MEVFYLPSYSPGLNPDEHLNAKEPLNNSFMVAPTSFRDGMQGTKRNAWLFHA